MSVNGLTTLKTMVPKVGTPLVAGYAVVELDSYRLFKSCNYMLVVCGNGT